MSTIIGNKNTSRLVAVLDDISKYADTTWSKHVLLKAEDLLDFASFSEFIEKNYLEGMLGGNNPLEDIKKNVVFLADLDYQEKLPGETHFFQGIPEGSSRPSRNNMDYHALFIKPTGFVTESVYFIDENSDGSIGELFEKQYADAFMKSGVHFYNESILSLAVEDVVLSKKKDLLKTNAYVVNINAGIKNTQPVWYPLGLLSVPVETRMEESEKLGNLPYPCDAQAEMILSAVKLRYPLIAKVIEENQDF